MDIRCHCGKVKLQLPTLPVKLNRCSCSICKRYGALWSYYAPESIKVSGSTDTYIWGDRMIAFHRCQNCGVVTHWTRIDGGSGNIGINMRNSDAATLSGIPEYDGHDQVI